MNTIFTFFTFSLVFTLNDALYSSNSDVIELTETNFNSRVKDSDHLWVIEFYAPWCGHCQAFASEYSKAATVLKGFVKVGGVDADQHKSLGGQYGVKGFPTVKLMYKGKVIDYTGPRTANGIVDAAFRELRRVVDNRLGGKEESSSGSDKDVIELTDDNFRKTVLESDDIWLVEFFAPWCGHCKNLEPHWKKAASELKGKVKLGALDATVYTVTANQYGVKGFPTIKFFPKGRANKHKVEDYDGGRTSGDIVTWALNKHIQDLPSPDVIQLTNEQVVKDVCESSQLCVISFLPHILDCDAKCRNGYLDTLKKVGDKFKQNGWGYLWSEAVSQPELEDSLGIGGFGYPAMAAVNIRKMKYSWLRGSFSQDGINEFLRDLSYGKGSSVPVKGAKLPKIHKVEEWDGKDGVPPVEEEYEDLNEGKSEL